MARTALILGMALAALAVAVAKPKPGKLDAVDVDAVLGNKRLFENYVKCIMDKGPCSAEGTELKERLPKYLETQCSACTDTEKERAKKVITHIRAERKDLWDEFQAKFDPDNKWGDLEWTGA